MKAVTLLLSILLFSSITCAEDVLIIHQGYANSHSKWKNRLEDAGHTVTSVNITSASFPSSTTSYEQIYDVRHGQGGTHLLTSAIETAYKALLARGGTLYLQTENPGCCNVRNQNIADFIEDELGGGTITYNSSVSTGYSSNSITQHNPSESWLSGFSGTVTFSAGGILTTIGNGKWFAKDGSGNIVGAVWYGSDLSSSYSGKVIVITDINYNSHSQYYTNNNKNWMNAMRVMLASTYNTAVTITSGQLSERTTALAATRGSGCNVCIDQTGNNVTINIQQEGEDNFVRGTDWSGDAVLTGDSISLTIKQGNVTSDGSSDDNGVGLSIAGASNNLTINQGDSDGDIGNHRAKIDITGTSNVLNLTQYDGGTLAKHYFSLDLDSNSNTIDVIQRDNGQKTMFLNIDNVGNDIDILQKDTGTHYLDLSVGGVGIHDIDITQQGTGNHAARITLDGYSTDFDLLQQGSTAQNYLLNNICSNALGCTTNVAQGTQ